MTKKIRDLEAEVYDLRRGIWHQRRKDMEFGGDDESASGQGRGKGLRVDPTSPGFTNVDLGSAGGLASPGAARSRGFGDFFASGISALTGGGDESHHNHGHRHGSFGVHNDKGAGGADDGFLDDEDVEFDEDAFRRAQEEDARRRLERIKDIKRGLKNWEGWRLDLVDSRRGAGYGVGEVFEV